jgi:hypothetical protein
MTLSDGQALVGAHILYAGSSPGNREAAAERFDATTLRAIRRASITGTFVTAKSGDKAAPWFRPAPPAVRDHSPTVIEPGRDYASLHGRLPQH